jgi:hypothetical protein
LPSSKRLRCHNNTPARNVDTNQPLAARYGVSSIPALFIFAGGKVVVHHLGITPEATLTTAHKACFTERSRFPRARQKYANSVGFGACSEPAMLIESVGHGGEPCMVPPPSAETSPNSLQGTRCPERLASLTIHHGRRTFISHALAGGRSLAEVRDAACHANVSITSGYLHIAVDDGGIGDLFGFAATDRA